MVTFLQSSTTWLLIVIFCQWLIVSDGAAAKSSVKHNVLFVSSCSSDLYATKGICLTFPIKFLHVYAAIFMYLKIILKALVASANELVTQRKNTVVRLLTYEECGYAASLHLPPKSISYFVHAAASSSVEERIRRYRNSSIELIAQAYDVQARNYAMEIARIADLAASFEPTFMVMDVHATRYEALL
jgi:hypothetical protein